MGKQFDYGMVALVLLAASFFSVNNGRVISPFDSIKQFLEEQLAKRDNIQDTNIEKIKVEAPGGLDSPDLLTWEEIDALPPLVDADDDDTKTINKLIPNGGGDDNEADFATDAEKKFAEGSHNGSMSNPYPENERRTLDELMPDPADGKRGLIDDDQIELLRRIAEELGVDEHHQSAFEELEKRFGQANLGYNMWTKNIVPYEFNDKIRGSSKAKREVYGAIRDVQKKTCIKFQPASQSLAKFVGHDAKVLFRGTNGNGCWSYIGRVSAKQFPQGQPINLQIVGCMLKRIIIHEIGHALGLFHMQNRPDRDDYVKVLWGNIKDSKKSQFERPEKFQGEDLPYDYMSIMHYGAYFFVKDRQAGPSIRTKQPCYQNKIGKPLTLSFYDAKALNTMYGCDSGCEAKSARCDAECGMGKTGYATMFGTNTQCKCICSKPALDTCKGGRMMGSDGIFYQKFGAKKSWKDAETICVASGGHLPIIYNSATSDAVSAIATTTWINAIDSQHEGRWRTSDGVPLPFTNWGKGEPNDHGKGEDCAIHKQDGTWNDAPCRWGWAFLCQFDTGLTKGSDGRFYWKHEARKSWKDAETICVASGGHLPVIYNSATMDAVSAITTTTWINAIDSQHEGRWRTSDGVPLPFTNWGKGEPNDHGKGEDCAIHEQDGTWNDAPCRWGWAFLCQFSHGRFW